MPRILIALAASFFQACATPVKVVDQASGKPIPGATVEPMSLSINYAPVTTNEKGVASIPWAPQKVEWLNVTKMGYRSKKSIRFNSSRLVPVKLLMEKVTYKR